MRAIFHWEYSSVSTKKSANYIECMKFDEACPFAKSETSRPRSRRYHATFRNSGRVRNWCREIEPQSCFLSLKTWPGLCSLRYGPKLDDFSRWVRRRSRDSIHLYHLIAKWLFVAHQRTCSCSTKRYLDEGNIEMLIESCNRRVWWFLLNIHCQIKVVFISIYEYEWVCL